MIKSIPLCFFIFLSGCAMVGRDAIKEIHIPRKPPQGFYHTVKQGQTLFSIARLYNIDMQTIIDKNHLPCPNRLEAGQRLFIPDAR
jgi:LysM repeat protein